MTRSRPADDWDTRRGRSAGRGQFPRRLSGSGRYSQGTLLTGWTAIAVTFVLVAGALFGYAKFRDVLDGISHIAVTDLGKRPPKYSDALNILVIGSDSRSGKNRKLGGFAQGQRSDTVMVVHISPGRSHIYSLSFPRDSVVPIYDCSKRGRLPRPDRAGRGRAA